MAPQIVTEICLPFEVNQLETEIRLDDEQEIPESDAKRKTKVTITAYPVMTRTWEGNVRLKSCLKKTANRLPQKSRILRFSLQTEVRYYLSRPLVAQSRLKRMISNIKGRVSAKCYQ